MNPTQKKIYEDWKKLEKRVDYSNSAIDFSDVEKVRALRPVVWGELYEFLSPSERFNLGADLGKKLGESLGHQWPPKKWKENEILAYGAVARAKSNLHFIEACLDHFHKSGTDPVYSRSLLILISYSTELIFESYLLLGDTGKSKKELLKTIKKGHNLVVLSGEIIKDKKNFLGLKGCKQKEKRGFIEYVIETEKGELIVQDLIDVRYDFVNYELRDVDPNEAENMRKDVALLFEMANKIIEKLPKI